MSEAVTGAILGAKQPDNELFIEKIESSTPTYLEIFRDAALSIITDDDIISLGKVEKIRVANSVDEILGLLSGVQLLRLEQVISQHPKEHLIGILNVVSECEKALNYYKRMLMEEGIEPTDENLINYLEKLKKIHPTRWKINKLLSLLYAKIGDYGTAIDRLNDDVLKNIDERDLWQICVYIGIYFEKMGEHEFARRFMATAQRVGGKMGLIRSILKIYERATKK